MLCLGLLAGLDRPGPCPGHLPSQPYHPARLFPLRKCRQLSFGARGKQVSEPRVMEPSEGGKTQGKLRKHTPAHTVAPRTGISSTPCWEREVPLLVTLVCPSPPHCLSPAPGTLQEGDGVAGAFLLSQPLLQSWAAASASILSPTMCLRRQVVRTAEPRSPTGRGPATHVPGNFPFSLLGWCRLRAGWTSCFFLFPVQAATGAVGTGMVW